MLACAAAPGVACGRLGVSAQYVQIYNDEVTHPNPKPDPDPDPNPSQSKPENLLQLLELPGLESWSHYTNRIGVEVGWDPAAEDSGYKPLEHRREAQVRILSDEVCRARLAGSELLFTAEMVCTERVFDPDGISKGLCDVGGPLLIHEPGRTGAVLVGLVSSWATTCDQQARRLANPNPNQPTRRLADHDHAGTPLLGSELG